MVANPFRCAYSDWLQHVCFHILFWFTYFWCGKPCCLRTFFAGFVERWKTFSASFITRTLVLLFLFMNISLLYQFWHFMYDSYVASVTLVHGSGTSKTITWHLYIISHCLCWDGFTLCSNCLHASMQNKSCIKICFPLFAVSMAWNVFRIKSTTVHYFCSFTPFSAFS